MCCATFRQAADQCLKSGLCSNTATGPNLTWRESCTDPTWKSPSCVKLCDTGIDENGSDRHEGDTMVLPCDDGSYCCNHNATDCCDQKKGVWILNGTTTDVNPATIQTSTSSFSTPIFSTSSSSSAGNPPTLLPQTSSGETSKPVPSSSPSSGAYAGIGVGAFALLVIALGLAIFFTRKRKRQRNMAQLAEQEGMLSGVSSKPPLGPLEAPGQERVEMDGAGKMAEMEVRALGKPELDGSSAIHEKG
ncbi:MAG: hypothetical protein Q9214_003133 [Letrouitia sp. 1 TL-2023]